MKNERYSVVLLPLAVGPSLAPATPTHSPSSRSARGSRISAGRRSTGPREMYFWGFKWCWKYESLLQEVGSRKSSGWPKKPGPQPGGCAGETEMTRTATETVPEYFLLRLGPVANVINLEERRPGDIGDQAGRLRATRKGV